jgi:hypothetical protein
MNVFLWKHCFKVHGLESWTINKRRQDASPLVKCVSPRLEALLPPRLCCTQLQTFCLGIATQFWFQVRRLDPALFCYHGDQGKEPHLVHGQPPGFASYGGRPVPTLAFITAKHPMDAPSWLCRRCLVESGVLPSDGRFGPWGFERSSL